MALLKKTIKLCFALDIILFLTGCGPIQTKVIENEGLETYETILNRAKPDDVEIINSLLVTYSPRFMVVTTPDWEIELIAGQTWIDYCAKKLYLRKTDPTDSHGYQMVKYRKEKDFASAWYAPKDISEYDVYYMFMTTVPYVHMLVDKTPVSENRYRIFLSKH